MKAKGVLKDQVPDAIKKIFSCGRYFILVMDYRDLTYTHVQGVQSMIGFSNEEFYNGKYEFLANLVHPDDLEKVLGLAAYYQTFLDDQPLEKRLSYKASINFRFRNASGEYIKVLEQVVNLAIDDNGKITHALKYFTDISHMTYSDEVVFSILNDKDEQHPEFYTFNLEEKSVPQINKKKNTTFSERERELVALVALGKTSKEIAAMLGITANTVNKHRENMMRKTGSKNMNEVVSFAYCNEYL